ncbi:MAG: cell division protein SepF [Lachnospiraceae bacterium]
MAGRLDNFIKFLKLTDEDEYDEDDFYDDYDDYDEKELRREEKRIQREQKKEEKRKDYGSSNYDEPVSFNSRKTTQRQQPGKVVPIHTASSSDVEVNIVKPANFGESQQICQILLDGQPVVVNLEGMDLVEAQRIMDFISGCIYSIAGNMRSVSRFIFIFSPKNIDISGDYIKSVTTSDEVINIPTLNKEF